MDPQRHLQCDGAVMPPLMQNIFMVVGWTLLVVLIAYALRTIRTKKDDMLLVMVIAGALAVPVETFNDFMVYCCFPPVGSNTLVHFFGTSLSWFEPPFYGIYVPLSAYVSLQFLKNSPSQSMFWRLFAINLLIDWAFEVGIVKITGIWFYYGAQPMLLGIPLVEPFVIATLIMLFALASLCCFQLLHGYRRYVLILVGSLPFGGAYLMCWPLTAALLGGSPAGTVLWGALATVALTLLSSYVVCQATIFIMGARGLSAQPSEAARAA